MTSDDTDADAANIPVLIPDPPIAPDPVPHPAQYSPLILDVFTSIIREWRYMHDDLAPLILDPMAGVGNIHHLGLNGEAATVALELEPEWAAMSSLLGVTYCGDFLAPFDWANLFNMVMTSCTYGNRMADHHDARDDSTRITYKHKLGHDPSVGSSAILQWGTAYRTFHRKAWAVVIAEVLEPGGWFVLNVKDHVRKGAIQPVAKWHRNVVLEMGTTLHSEYKVPAPGMRFGENHDARVEHEMVYVFIKPEGWRNIRVQS